jgi:hypothetical protein
MKKLLILLSLSVSIVAAGQVDPAFTAKMITYVNAVKDHHYSSEADKPSKLDAIDESLKAFFPITEAQFTSKATSMLNSTTEMAKFTGPVAFVQCLAQEAVSYTNCLRGFYINGLWHSNPDCKDQYAEGIITCAINNLTH